MSEIKQRASREIYANPWLRLREDEIEYADGSTGSYAVVEKPDFVIIVPWENHGFWLVQQYRYAVGSRQWEFPQGGWPHGHGGTPDELAIAELAEETGLSAGRWSRLGRLFAAYGYCAQAFDVFLATDLTPGPTRHEHSEQGMVHRWFGTADLRAMIASGEFADSHSVAAMALYDLHNAPG